MYPRRLLGRLFEEAVGAYAPVSWDIELRPERLARELGLLACAPLMVFSCLLSRVGVAVGPPTERRLTCCVLRGVDSEADSL